MNSFEPLREFISMKMRMSHIYQPVMIKTPLKNRGKASAEQIAKAVGAGPELSHPADVAVSHVLKPIRSPPGERCG